MVGFERTFYLSSKCPTCLWVSQHNHQRGFFGGVAFDSIWAAGHVLVLLFCRCAGGETSAVLWPQSIIVFFSSPVLPTRASGYCSPDAFCNLQKTSIKGIPLSKQNSLLDLKLSGEKGISNLTIFKNSFIFVSLPLFFLTVNQKYTLFITFPLLSSVLILLLSCLGVHATVKYRNKSAVILFHPYGSQGEDAGCQACMAVTVTC